MTVGQKHMIVSVAGRNVTIDKTQTDLSPKCVATYYGQQEDSIHWGPILDMCGDECRMASWKCMDSWDPLSRNHSDPECADVKHCEFLIDLQGDIKNCTVLTRQDEYERASEASARAKRARERSERPPRLVSRVRPRRPQGGLGGGSPPTTPTCTSSAAERKNQLFLPERALEFATREPRKSSLCAIEPSN
jgi:hypothetical protein